MILRLYSIRDNVANHCDVPFACPNDDVALRHFRLFKEAHKLIADDFSLLVLGEFDTDSGVISAFKLVEQLDDIEVSDNVKNL